MKLAVAIPTYNESKNLTLLLPLLKKELRKCKDVECRVFIIDDNSPDKTANVALELGRKLRNKKFSIEVIRRPRKEGLGAAYINGFKKILKKDFDFILQMDADLSHDPKHIPQIISKSKTADFVVGTRYIKGGRTPDWGLIRRIVSKGGNLYARLILSNRLKDYTGGFNLFSAKLLDSLEIDSLETAGYGFLIQLKYRALKTSRRTAQVPIIFIDRQHGKSKIPKNTIIKNLFLVPQIRLHIK